jgi:hypothetical protein
MVQLRVPVPWLPNRHHLPFSCQLVNRLICVNYSFRHVGTIRLTLAPHPLGLYFDTTTKPRTIVRPAT